MKSPNYRLLDIKYLILRKVWLYLLGTIKRNLMPVFYVKWSNNFGDLLTPLILKHYGFTPVFAYPKKAKCAVVGTILNILPSNFSGYIIGSGWTKWQMGTFPDAIIYGVRGMLTKHFLRIDKDVCIGDPGLLISQIYPCENSKKYKLGIIPHESEVKDIRLKEIQDRAKDSCIIIDPRNKNCRTVLRLINSCEYIVSSSLHGLIVSDSYGIPNGRIKINELDENKDFKFYDYFSSLSEPLNTYQINGSESIDQLVAITRIPDISKINGKKKEINAMFKQFANDLNIKQSFKRY